MDTRIYRLECKNRTIMRESRKPLTAGQRRARSATLSTKSLKIRRLPRAQYAKPAKTITLPKTPKPSKPKKAKAKKKRIDESKPVRLTQIRKNETQEQWEARMRQKWYDRGLPSVYAHKWFEREYEIRLIKQNTRQLEKDKGAPKWAKSIDYQLRKASRLGTAARYEQEDKILEYAKKDRKWRYLTGNLSPEEYADWLREDEYEELLNELKQMGYKYPVYMLNEYKKEYPGEVGLQSGQMGLLAGEVADYYDSINRYDGGYSEWGSF